MSEEKNVIFKLDGKTYKQKWQDSEGRKPNMPPGTKVTACGGRYSGEIKHQRLHFDVGGVLFWQCYCGR